MRPDEVTAVIVTRGNVPLDEIRESLIFDNVVVWDNSVDPDYGAFGRCEAARKVATPYVYFQDDDLIVRREWQERLLESYVPGHLIANMPTGDYRPGDVRPWMHHLVWQGWGALIATADVMLAHERWVRSEKAVDKDYFIVGGDVVLGMLIPHIRLDIDAGRSTGLHGQDRPRTSAMPDDYDRKMRFYLRCCEILVADDLDEIREAIHDHR